MKSSSVSTFLGTNAVQKIVQGNMLALTSYSAAALLEEPHNHTNTSISLLLNGSHREDLSGKKYLRTPGDIKIVPGGEIHRCYDYQSGTKKINLELNDLFLKHLNVDPDTLLGILQNSHNAKFTLLKLFREIDDNGTHSQASSELLFLQLVDMNANTVKHRRSSPRWTIQLKQLLNDEWATTFELRSLSAILGVHPVTISRYFPLYFGSTLGGYIKGIKVDRALKMIRDSSLSLTEVAYRCGFADQAHFTPTFKTYTGHLPKEYRKI